MSEPPANPPAKWALAALAIAVSLAISAAHLPGQIGVFARSAPIFAVISGWLFAWLSGQFGLAKTRRRVLAAGLLTAAAFAGTTLESYRLRVAELREQFRNDPSMFLTTRLLQHANGADEREAAAAAEQVAAAVRNDREAVLAARSSFAACLRHRVSSAGRWPAPWPALFWIGEIALTGVVGSWLFARLVPVGDRKTAAASHAGD